MVRGFDSGYAGSGLKGTLFLSLLLHAALLALLSLSPSFPSAKITFGPVYNVSLVDSPGGSISSGNASSPGNVPAAEKEFKKERRDKTKVKRNQATAPAVPIGRIEDRGRDDHALEKAIANIKKKAAAGGGTQRQLEQTSSPNRAASEAKSGTGSSGQTGAGSGEGGGVTGPSGGDTGGDARVNVYYRQIWS